MEEKTRKERANCRFRIGARGRPREGQTNKNHLPLSSTFGLS